MIIPPSDIFPKLSGKQSFINLWLSDDTVLVSNEKGGGEGRDAW